MAKSAVAVVLEGAVLGFIDSKIVWSEGEIRFGLFLGQIGFSAKLRWHRHGSRQRCPLLPWDIGIRSAYYIGGKPQ